MLKDLALDSNGDLYISDDGDFAIADSLRQAIQIKLRWALGEWMYNEELGIPYFEKVFIKKPNLQEIENLIRNELLDFDEVNSVEYCTVTFDESSRSATCKFSVKTDDETIESEVEYS